MASVAQLDAVAKRREHKPRPADLEAVASVKKTLAQNQNRVIDIFLHWDIDTSAAITIDELRRALAALAIPIEPRALKLLFREIDKDGSGEITFRELNAVIRKQYDRDTGDGEFFDAETGTYTTRAVAVKQVKSSSLPAISTSAVAPTVLPPQRIGPSDAAMREKADKHMDKRRQRENQAFLNREKMNRQSTRTRLVHDVPPKEEDAA